MHILNIFCIFDTYFLHIFNSIIYIINAYSAYFVAYFLLLDVGHGSVSSCRSENLLLARGASHARGPGHNNRRRRPGFRHRRREPKYPAPARPGL